MIYDVVEEVYAKLAASFNTDYATVLATKSIASPGTVQIVKRRAAEAINAYGPALPAIGVYPVRALTQAKNQARRTTMATIACDWLIEGSDDVLVAKQTELALEALLLTVDRLIAGATGVYAAAPLDGDVSIDVEPFAWARADGSTNTPVRRVATVTFPVYDEEVGL